MDTNTYHKLQEIEASLKDPVGTHCYVVSPILWEEYLKLKEEIEEEQ